MSEQLTRQEKRASHTSHTLHGNRHLHSVKNKPTHSRPALPADLMKYDVEMKRQWELLGRVPQRHRKFYDDTLIHVMEIEDDVEAMIYLQNRVLEALSLHH